MIRWPPGRSSCFAKRGRLKGLTNCSITKKFDFLRLPHRKPMTIGHDLSLEFEFWHLNDDFVQPSASEADSISAKVGWYADRAVFFKLNQPARNPVQLSVATPSYTLRTSVARFATTRNSLSQDRDPDGPFVEEQARPKRT